MALTPNMVSPAIAAPPTTTNAIPTPIVSSACEFWLTYFAAPVKKLVMAPKGELLPDRELGVELPPILDITVIVCEDVLVAVIELLIPEHAALVEMVVRLDEGKGGVRGSAGEETDIPWVGIGDAADMLLDESVESPQPPLRL